MSKEIKKHINYHVMKGGVMDKANNEVSKYFYGGIRWFTGEMIAERKSERFDNKQDAWAWVAEQLKEIDNDD